MTSIKPVPDAISDVLSLLRTRSDFVCASECAAPYSLSFPSRKAHFHMVEQGAAYLQLQGQAPIRLQCGDLAILPRGAGHILSSDPHLVPVPIERAFRDLAVGGGRIVRIGRPSAAATRTVCGQFAFEGVLAPRVLTVLPQLIHVRHGEQQPAEWLRLTSSFLAAEVRSARPGANAVVDRLLEVLLVQALRQWAHHSLGAHGWLGGLMDAQVGKALAVIHDDPARTWTVESLAGLAGLSRSAFAARFAAVVGQPPLKYLTAWRLNLAANHLRVGGASLREIAARVGYGSEAALTRAFKAQFATTPAAFRRDGPAGAREPRRRGAAPIV